MFGSGPKTLIAPLAERSFRHHLMRALIDWCEEEGCTPYALIQVDDSCAVPREFVNKDGTIVLCISSEATHAFEIDEEGMRFQARFGESVREIDVPLERIAIIYPKEDPSKASYFPVTTPQRQEKGETKFITPTFTKV